MLFSRPLILDSALPVAVTRSRLREFATARHLPELETLRRRQIIGWRLSDLNEDFLFQPEYGDRLNIDGARFVGLVEPAVAGSRIRGFVVLSPLARVAMSAFMLAVVIGTAVTLGAGRGSEEVLFVATTMIGSAVLTVRHALRSTSRLAEERLRLRLEQRRRKAAA